MSSSLPPFPPLVPPAGSAPLAPPEPEPAPAPDPEAPVYQAGDLLAYTHLDVYASPPADRHQIILAVRVSGDGRVQGIPVGYADQLAVFDADQLAPLDEL